VNTNPTCLVNASFALGGNPDAITLDVRDGDLVLVLGQLAIVLNVSGQDAIDKLATATAEAAAVNRSRSLRQVA
jgi:hypothetical protein